MMIFYDTYADNLFLNRTDRDYSFKSNYDIGEHYFRKKKLLDFQVIISALIHPRIPKPKSRRL